MEAGFSQIQSHICITWITYSYHMYINTNTSVNNTYMCIYVYIINLYIIKKFAILKKGIGIESEKVCKQVMDQIVCTFLVLYPLLHYHCSLLTSQIFLVFTPSPFCFFRCFPIPSEPMLLPPMSKIFFVPIQHEQ